MAAVAACDCDFGVCVKQTRSVGASVASSSAKNKSINRKKTYNIDYFIT